MDTEAKDLLLLQECVYDRQRRVINAFDAGFKHSLQNPELVHLLLKVIPVLVELAHVLLVLDAKEKLCVYECWT